MVQSHHKVHNSAPYYKERDSLCKQNPFSLYRELQKTCNACSLIQNSKATIDIGRFQVSVIQTTIFSLNLGCRRILRGELRAPP